MSAALATILVSALPLSAQTTVTVDLGSARVRYADSLDVTAYTVSPSLQLSSQRAALDILASASQLGSGGWTAQSALDGTLYVPAAGRFLGELSASLGGSAHRDGYRTAQLLGLGRIHLTSTGYGAWLGAGLGSNWDGDMWRSVRQGEAGAWLRSGEWSATLTATPTAVDDSIRYFDSLLSLSRTARTFEVHAQAGYRVGDQLPTLGGRTRIWGSVSVVGWVLPQAALVAGAGAYPVDFTQGFPGGRFLTLGIRLRPAPRKQNEPAVLIESETNGTAPADAAAPITQFQTQRAAGDNLTVRLHAAHAKSVEIAADFTNWKPLQLAPAENDWWTITIPVSAGTYQLNVRINNSEWLVPPGLPAVADEFGGRVGILVLTQ